MSVTTAPAGAFGGVTPDRLGCVAGRTAKSVALVAVSTALVTVIGPVLAPKGTVAVICVEPLMANAAGMPRKATREVPSKPAPEMTTLD